MTKLSTNTRAPRQPHDRLLKVITRVALTALAIGAMSAAVPAAGAQAGQPPARRDVFAFGNAQFLGSTGNAVLAHPITGVTSTPTGHGYWLVATDGGIFSFGDARFYGSTGNLELNQPIVGMAAAAKARGYWLVARDGGIFRFGGAPFLGSAGAHALSAPVTGMAATPTARGYWLTTRDGHVFAYGDASRISALGTTATPQSVVGIAAGSDARGYWLATANSLDSGPTSSEAEAAIAWFEARAGSTAFEGRCETAVENAFGTTSMYPTARSNWRARPDQHADWQDAPRGALVFYDTSADGHVAISLGDGNVISTSANHRIGIEPIGYFQNPLGWASSPW